MKKYSLLRKVEDYPGFWLNVVGLTLVTAVMVVCIKAEVEDINHRCARTRASVEHTIRGVAGKQVDLHWAHEHLARDLEPHWFHRGTDWFGLDPEGELENARRGRGSNTEYYKRMVAEIDHALKRIFASDVNISDDKAKNLAADVEGSARIWLESHATYSSRWRMYLLWIVLTIAYCTVVGCMYTGRKLHLSSGEPMLNIVDVSIYFAAIGWAGGLASPIKWVLALSTAAAIYDFWRLWQKRSSLSTFSSITEAAVDYVGHFGASLIYLLFLWMGFALLALRSPDDILRPLLVSGFWVCALVGGGLLLLWALYLVVCMTRRSTTPPSLIRP